MTTPAAPNTRYTLQVLSTHSSDSGPSALITFDQQRYLFNTPESLSRVCVQGRVGLRKVSNFFLGSLEESAGLPGLVLSTVEAGNRKLEVTGPAGTDHLLASCRFFCRREQLTLKLTTPPAGLTGPLTTLPTPIFADHNLTVHALPLVPSSNLAAVSPSSSTSSLKRPRSSASPSPPPRTKSPPPAASTSAPPADTPMSVDTPAEAERPTLDMSSPDFAPQHLKGAEAAVWRQMVLDDMFRAQDPDQPSQPLPRSTYNQTASYMPVALPKLNLPRHRQSEVLSYLAIGPPLRGKFLVAEANKRGVVGQACSKLVKGERVWVPEFETALDETPKTLADGKVESKKQVKIRTMKEQKAREAGVVEGEGKGKWVTPEECLSDPQEGSAVLIVNIPSPDYLDSLAHLPASLLTNLPNASLKTILSFAGAGVLADPRLAEWLNSFPSSIIHRVSSPDVAGNDPVSFVPAALLSLRLSYLSSDIFRLPSYKALPAPAQGGPTSAVLPPALPAGTTLLKNADLFSQGTVPTAHPPSLAPRLFDFAVPSAEADKQAGLLAGPERPAATRAVAEAAWASYLPTARAAAAEVEADEAALKASGNVTRIGDDLKLTALGTGSAIPSKYRNVSGTLLHLPEGGFVLMDAGEGTWGQLARRFGTEGEESVSEVLRGIKLIFNSHIHQDHHAGLATILRHRTKLSPPPTEPLTIVCPSGTRSYLWEQQELFDLGLSRGTDAVRFVDNNLVEPNRSITRDDTRQAVADVKALLGLKEIIAVPVLHRCRAWGLVLEHESGWKTVFSGDTMPSEELVTAGQGASLLVHEATMEDGLEDMARAKGHSTFGQAIDVARRMRARHLLLTHFSARYPKLPPLSVRARSPSTLTADALAEAGGAGKAVEPVVAVAFDLATLRLDQFWQVERYRPAMDALLGWEEEGKEEATEAGSVVGDK